MRGLILGIALGLAPMTAGAETLADVRAEVSQLGAMIAQLQKELTATGSSNPLAGDAATLDRLNAMEAALQRLTAKTEELDFRIKSVVKDGTNRVGDLEFRLCELDPACDIGTLPETSVLGGGTVAPVPAPQPQPETPQVQVAVGEEADFNAAKTALEANDYQTAANRLAQFNEAYPGGPYSIEASLLLGNAQAGLGQMAPAARAYLDAFSQSPDGPFAPEALYSLGTALGDLGQTSEACVTLAEVGNRFAASEFVLPAQSARQNLGCS
ncbi:tol-pal system protein YbgF [Algirhabdus cladophorae]|uniref:tol-pal system protein YbgF n=1 Tax=Algirhabdus cladophorae TaxID=3377108 RepID=UPI003B848259